MCNVKECPIEPAYLFKTNCTIETCKYYAVSVDSHCLSLAGIMEGERSLTDAELLLYKYPKTNMSEKDVSALRRKATDRVRAVVSLYACLVHIKEYCDKVEDFAYSDKGIVSELAKKNPLSIIKLGFEPWMFVYLLDDSVLADVCGPKFQLRVALALNQREYQTLMSEVQPYRR
jgi:hypothetical protein